MTNTRMDTGPADRSRINIDDDWELRWWCNHLGCTADQLREAVRAVGLDASKVGKLFMDKHAIQEGNPHYGTAVELLLVEDNPIDAELTMRTLKKNKFFNPMHWVKDGQEALDFLFCRDAYANRKGAAPPKLILLDIKMPKVGGLEVLEQIKKDPYLRTVPVVIMTSSSLQPDIAEAYRLGANSYVVKPVEFAAFAEKVEQVGLYWIKTNEGGANAVGVT